MGVIAARPLIKQVYTVLTDGDDYRVLPNANPIDTLFTGHTSEDLCQQALDDWPAANQALLIPNRSSEDRLTKSVKMVQRNIF